MWGRYRVTGKREYRGHPPGALFIARLELNAQRRAVARGDIRLVEEVRPGLPAEYGLPDGWTANNNSREE